MRKSRFSDEHIVAVLAEHDGGTKTAECGSGWGWSRVGISGNFIAVKKVNERMEIPWDNTPLHQWAKQVHEALDVYREATIRFENPKGIPRVTLSQLQVQWYQGWEGPHRWVTWEWFEQSLNMVVAYFWTDGEWEERDRRIETTDDVAGFAGQVWDFLKLLKD